MAAMLKTIMSKEGRTEKSYKFYILVDESIVAAAEVSCHLESYRLMAKPSELLEEGVAFRGEFKRQVDLIVIFKFLFFQSKYFSKSKSSLFFTFFFFGLFYFTV